MSSTISSLVLLVLSSLLVDVVVAFSHMLERGKMIFTTEDISPGPNVVCSLDIVGTQCSCACQVTRHCHSLCPSSLHLPFTFQQQSRLQITATACALPRYRSLGPSYHSTFLNLTQRLSRTSSTVVTIPVAIQSCAKHGYSYSKQFSALHRWRCLAGNLDYSILSTPFSSPLHPLRLLPRIDCLYAPCQAQCYHPSRKSPRGPLRIPSQWRRLRIIHALCMYSYPTMSKTEANSVLANERRGQDT
jgi:hypothetical protein